MFDAVDDGIIVVVVDFVAISADVEMLFGEEAMMNSAVSMFAFLGGKRDIFLGLPLLQYSFWKLQIKEYWTLYRLKIVNIKDM